MKLAQVITATAFALAVSLTASAALATNTREAIDACSKNPKCNMDVGNDGVVISVGGSLIVCPIKNGPCGVAHIGPSRFNPSVLSSGLEFQTMQ